MSAALLLALVAVSPPPPPAERVVLISLDGVPAAELHDEANALPRLRALARRGVHGSLRTVLPSVTWPAHTTLVTGVLPARHGVVGNHWIDRRTGREVHAWVPTKEESVATPTLYDVAHAAGRRTAAVLWPQVSGAPTLHLAIPEVYGEALFDRYVTPSLRRELKAAGIGVERLAALSADEEVPLDELAADVAEHVIRKHAPHLLLLHLTSADTRGHRAGPKSDRYRAGLAVYDRLVGRVLDVLQAAGLAERTAVLVVSDHGFFETRWQVDAAKVLARAGLKAPAARVANNGHLAYVYLQGGAGHDERLRRAVAALRGQEQVERVVLGPDFPALGLPTPKANDRVGDLLALVRPDCTFGPVAGAAVVGRSPRRGMHGYLPDPPENHALFIAAGAGIATRAAPLPARAVDVAPTAAALLGLAMDKPQDGRVLTELLRP